MVSEEYALKSLTAFQDRMQNARSQETKDSVLCQTVILLSHFAPVQVKEEALELLRTYNAEDRIEDSDVQEEQIAMEIEKGLAPTGFQYISFVAKYQEKYTLVACDKLLRCAVRKKDDVSMHAPFTHFAREQVKAVLPYLQSFAETGTFGEEQQEDSEDEDEEQSLEEELLTMQEAGIAMASNIVDQGKRIAALQALVREWRIHLHDRETLQNAAQYELWEQCSEEMLKKTAKLLGESDDRP